MHIIPALRILRQEDCPMGLQSLDRLGWDTEKCQASHRVRTCHEQNKIPPNNESYWCTINHRYRAKWLRTLKWEHSGSSRQNGILSVFPYLCNAQIVKIFLLINKIALIVFSTAFWAIISCLIDVAWSLRKEISCTENDLTVLPPFFDKVSSICAFRMSEKKNTQLRFC